MGDRTVALTKKFGVIQKDGDVPSISYANTYGHKSNFEVTHNKLPQFLKEYCDAVIEEEDLSIAEVATRNSLPLMVTLDLKFNLEDDIDEETYFYSNALLLKITQIIQEIIVEKIDTSGKLSEIICCVLESKPWMDKKNLYFKIKFHFPYCQLDINYQKNTFKPLLINSLRKHRILTLFNVQPIGDWDRILEDNKSVVSMYGSKESPEQNVMELSHIYGHLMNETIDPAEYDDGEEEGDVYEVDLDTIFSSENYSLVHSGSIKPDFLSTNMDNTHWLPLFLSIHFWGSTSVPKELSTAERKEKKTYNLMEDEDDKNPKYLAPIFLDMLNPIRFQREDYWTVIGMTLFNIYDGEDEGLDLFTQHSKKNDFKKKTEIKCQSKYYSFRESHFDIRTLGWYARIDNKYEYDMWHHEWCQDALKDALTLVHNDAMEAIYRVFWLDYITTGDGKNSWYYYTKNHFKKLKDASQLRKDINDVLIPIYKRMRTEASERSFENHNSKKGGDKYSNKNLDGFIQQISSLIKKFGTYPFVTTVINMSVIRFIDDKFLEMKDVNTNTTGWVNGVVECCGGEAYFREGKPQDYITMSTRIMYKKDFTWDHPLVVELMDWLSKVFCDGLNRKTKFSKNNKCFELLHYFLKDSAAHLVGRNAEKLFRIWLGGTNASKSIITKLYQYTFGQYCVDLPLSLITKTLNGGSSGPSPETAQLKGAHTGFYTEPDADDDMVAGKIKKRTGRDRFFARMCNDNGGAIEATAKEILVTNVIPDIKNLDEATRNRFAVLLFLSKFVDNAPKDINEQFEKRRFQNDPFFEHRLPELSLAFGWVCVQYFRIYKEEGLEQPKIIKEFIANHWEEVDPFNNFITENIDHAYTEESVYLYEQECQNGNTEDIRVIDENVTITAIDMYPKFQKWFRDNNPGREIPDSKKFKREMLMENRLGRQNQRKQWLGIKILTNEEKNKKRERKN
jgi:phage/plasmid-associated DNA primase